MNSKFDVIIIGAGVAGSRLATSLKRAGKTVAIIENNLYGGTCPNRGCDPKKILLAAVQAKQSVTNLQNNGLRGELEIDWHDLMNHKRQYTRPISQSTKQSLEKAGVQTFDGNPYFNEDQTITINGQVLRAEKYVIATGQRPAILPISGQQYLKTSTDFLDLDELPKDITLIGAGYIGFELAAIANGAGAKVHLINHNDHPLSQFDSQLVEQLITAARDKEIEVILNTNVTKIVEQDHGYYLTGDDGFELTTDMVFSTAGRIANVDTLKLANVNVEYDERHGITVNDHLQTSNTQIYAMGDVINDKIPKLTPVASYHAGYLSDELLAESNEALSMPVVPTILFAQPSLGQVGIVAAQVKGDDRYQIKHNDVTKWFTYYKTNERIAQVTTVIEKASQKLVGASVLADNCEELINLFTKIINDGTPVSEVKNQLFAYPTHASDLEYLI